MARSISAGPIRAFPALDGLRGIAAILVALFHYRGNFAGFDNYPCGDGYLAVDLFFVLSGFVICHAYITRFERGMTVRQFMTVRLIRLYPLYVLGLVLALATFLIGLEPMETLTRAKLAEAFFLESAMLPSWPTLRDQLFVINPVSWSLFFEIIVNLLFVACWRRLKVKTLALIITTSAAVLVAATFYRHNASAGNFWRTAIIGFPRTFLSFGMGILICKAHRWGTLRINVSPIVFLMAIGVLIAYLITPVNQTIRAAYDLGFIFIVSPALVVAGTSSHLEARWIRVFSFLGGTSYALYVVHASFIPLTTMAARRWSGTVSYTAIAIISVTTMLTMSHVLDLVYDRPIRRALMARLAGRRETIGGTAGCARQ